MRTEQRGRLYTALGVVLLAVFVLVAMCTARQSAPVATEADYRSADYGKELVDTTSRPKRVKKKKETKQSKKPTPRDFLNEPVAPK